MGNINTAGHKAVRPRDLVHVPCGANGPITAQKSLLMSRTERASCQLIWASHTDGKDGRGCAGWEGSMMKERSGKHADSH